MISEPYAKIVLWTKSHYQPYYDAEDPEEEFKRQLALIGIPLIGTATRGHSAQTNLLWSTLKRICADQTEFERALYETTVRKWRKTMYTPFDDPSASLWLRYALKSQIGLREVYDAEGDPLLPDVTLETIEHPELGTLEPKPSSDYAKQPA